MSSLDVLRYSLAIGFLVIAVSFAFTAYRLLKVFKSLERLIDDVEDAAKDVKILKDAVKTGLAGLAGILLRKAVKKVKGKTKENY